MLIKSTNSKYKLKSSTGRISTKEAKGDQILVSFFKENQKIYNYLVDTQDKDNVYYIKSIDKLFREHYFYKSTDNKNRGNLDKRDVMKSGVIYY